MDMKQIAKLEVDPDQGVREITTAGSPDQPFVKAEHEVIELLVAKHNQVIDELTKLQHIAVAMGTVLTATKPEDGDGQPEAPARH